VQREQLLHLVEREAELLRTLDESQHAKRLVVVAAPPAAAMRLLQQTALLVIPDGFDMDAGVVGKLAGGAPSVHAYEYRSVGDYGFKGLARLICTRSRGVPLGLNNPGASPRFCMIRTLQRRLAPGNFRRIRAAGTVRMGSRRRLPSQKTAGEA
jgi:hypothetical protein